jgi:putative membrane protein insertion efficiency factor
MINFIFKFPSLVVVGLINIYQATLSPDHGLFKARFPYGFCRHYPSCSEYSKQAVKKHGFFKGIFLGFVRVLKCNPFSQPKVDPV